MRTSLSMTVMLASMAGFGGGCRAGSATGDTSPTTATTSSATAETNMAEFRPTREMGYGQHFGSDRRVSLPVPVRRPSGPLLAVFLVGDVVARAGMTAKEAEDLADAVTVPHSIHRLDPRSGAIVEDTLQLNERRSAYFGIPDPPGSVVGRLDDPKWLSKDRLSQLRERILSALDVLLPFFADDTRPWTEQATKAAQEVRDFFPLAAEPGLWPYYRAEGKDFFSWVEKNAPAAKAPLPW